MTDLVHSDASVEELCRTGKEFLDQRRFAEAEWQFTQARDREPDNPEVYYCIGLFFADLAKPAEALVAFDRAIDLHSAHARAHNNRGTVLQQLGRIEEAEAAFRRALELAPDDAPPYINLANVVDHQFRTAEALAIYDLALKRGVAPDLIGQYRASLLGKSTTRPPDAWVRSTYDNFAPTFDQNLSQLKYAVPAAIAQLLDGKVEAGQHVLDLGCGTGWMGMALAGKGLEFTGVDLSERMIAQARERGYRDLHVAEIHAYLAGCPAASVDLVTAADVFILVGKLNDLFEQVVRVLKPHGLFAFSIEETSAADYSLQSTRRYAHSRAYLRTLTAFRFAPVDEWPGVIRLEQGKPVHGRVYLLRKA
ncbi:MAG: methyltransferase domain-containing protein [Burkholderiales bacterium]|nr:methyltransferase domain-containing protein [Burkholderiales bacterium]